MSGLGNLNGEKQQELPSRKLNTQGLTLIRSKEYLAHYQSERNHQGIGNVIPFPDQRVGKKEGNITKSERIGMLNYYYRKIA